MIPKELKALIDEYCMGVKDINKVDEKIANRIMDETDLLPKADAEEVQKYMDEVIMGPTKAEREAAAKAEAERKAKEAAERAKREKEEAERKAKEAAERAERERLAAIERAKREKEEAERKAKEAAERAQREKEEAERAEKERIEKAKQDAIRKRKSIAQMVIFSIVCVGAFFWEYFCVEGTWNIIFVSALVLIALVTNLSYCSKDKYDHVGIDLVITICAGLLLQHFYVHGFGLTLLSLVAAIGVPALLFPFITKVKRIVTWIIVLLTIGCLSFADTKSVAAAPSVETIKTIEDEDSDIMESSQQETNEYDAYAVEENDEEEDDESTMQSADKEYEQKMKSVEKEYERAMKSAEEEYDRTMKAAEEEYDRIMKSFE